MLMEYQETGRIGRITKNLRKLGFEDIMDKILFDSIHFTNLNKSEKTEYIEIIIKRMQEHIGFENTNKVLFDCGSQCCGKSWSDFAMQIWKDSKTIEKFIINANKAEEKYNTKFFYDPINNTITVIRTKCICGLINKGEYFKENCAFCNCSIGHMDKFFRTIFKVKNISLKTSIYSGDKECKWIIEI